MDGLSDVLTRLRDEKLVAGHLRGIFHLAIGRRITTPSGAVVSTGVTWRELSVLLKELRFDKELVAEVGADPDELAPRDRQRFWYSAIAIARPDSSEAIAQADRLAPALKRMGYILGPGPTVPPSALPPRPAKKKEPPPPPKRKK